MSMWLYQLNQKLWGPQRYRMEIWEGERWSWSVGEKKLGPTAEPPRPGDTVVFFYAKTGGYDPGFYGWAVVTAWVPKEEEAEKKDHIYFRPVAPSDHLKMDPWWDGDHGVAEQLADRIRGPFMQATLWWVSEPDSAALRRGIKRWLSGEGGIR